MKDKKINIPDNTNPFVAPDKYFDTFSSRIMERIDQEQEAKPKGIVKYLKPILSMAASFIIIFFLIYFPVKYFAPKTATNLNPVESEYINFEYFNDHTIFAELEEEDNYEYDEEMTETFLLASVSELELMELN